MILLICVCYYCLAIIGCFFRYYFKKFTEYDYRYNQSLNRKRVCSIIYCYFILAYSGFMFMLMQDKIITNMIIFVSVIVIIIIYISFSSYLEFAIVSKKNKKK